METLKFDFIVIGAGSAGISAVNLAKGLGKSVALVEKRKIGGDCTHYGCVPSKALLKAAEIAQQTRNLSKYGLSSNGLKLESNGVMAHVRDVIGQVYDGEKPEHFEEMGIRVFFGNAKFLDAHRLQVGETVLTGKKFLLCTGSSPFVPPIEGLDEIEYLTNESLFYIDALPKSIIVLGGGPIGIEMASALNRLGVDVTVVEMLERILFREEPELVEILVERLKSEGLKILTKTKALKFSKTDDGIALTVENPDQSTSVLTAETALVAVGRKPNVNGMDLENAGVKYSPKGIEVDSRLRTSAPNIYAAGDIASPYQFSHIAEYQATIATQNALLPLPIKKKVDYSNVVWATFTDPELARAGLTEDEAREQYGDRIRVYRFNFKNADRPRTDVAATGMSKFITDHKGKLLGIHILGNRASELLHEAQLIRMLGLPFSKISSMVHIYPSYGDVVKRPAARAYVDQLQNNFFIKLLQKLKPAKKTA